MGCSSSSSAEATRGSSSNSPTPVANRDTPTFRQIEIVKDSWAIIAEDRAGNGLKIFTRIFEIDAQMKELFLRFAKPVDNKDEDPVITIDDSKFRLHVDMVMQLFGECVEGLDSESNLEEHLETIRQVGQAHRKYNIQASMFQTFWPALKPLLQGELKDIYTEEVDESWDHVCNFITNKMTEGLERKEVPDDQTAT